MVRQSTHRARDQRGAERDGDAGERVGDQRPETARNAERPHETHEPQVRQRQHVPDPGDRSPWQPVQERAAALLGQTFDRRPHRIADRDDDQRGHGGDAEEQHVQQQLVDPGVQSEADRGVEERIAVERGADHDAAPPRAVTRGSVRDRQRAQFGRVRREHAPDQRDRGFAHNGRADQVSRHHAGDPFGLHECQHGKCRHPKGQHGEEIDDEAQRRSDRARQRPLPRAARQPVPGRRERPQDQEIGNDAEPERRQAADAGLDPQPAARGVAPLGLQPSHQQRKLFDGIDDPERDVPHRGDAIVDDLRGRRERIVRRDRRRGPGLFLGGEQGAQVGEQLVASGRILDRLDQAAQLRLFGHRIGWRLGRLPALHEGARHLSMSGRGAQGQQQHKQAATNIDAPHDCHTSGNQRRGGLPGGASKARGQCARHPPQPGRHREPWRA